uniref:Uncharacterized protein n=1 Tax=Macrostomum lignano TaxID=282301 RepID=A0A1I8FN96_9PLAT
MFNCVRPPEQQQPAAAQPQQQLEPDVASVGANSIAATGAPPPSSRCRPAKVRESPAPTLSWKGVTLSHGILFAKVRLLRGGRVSASTPSTGSGTQQVSWSASNQPPMECVCAGPATPVSPPPPCAAAVHLRVFRAARGGERRRSYTKHPLRCDRLTDLAWMGDTEQPGPAVWTGQQHTSSLKPAAPAALRRTSTAADYGSVASAVAAPRARQRAPCPHVRLHLLAALAPWARGGLGHRRNASNFSLRLLGAYPQQNPTVWQQEAHLQTPASLSSVPSFDLALSSSLERRRAALTPARELSSRIANTRTDNFQIEGVSSGRASWLGQSWQTADLGQSASPWELFVNEYSSDLSELRKFTFFVISRLPP